MRNAAFAVLFALGLAACDQNKPTVGAAPAPAPAPAQPPVAAKPAQPAPAPRLSADALLASKIKSALRAADNLDAQGVDATVADGVVTLHGTAAAPEESRRIAGFVAKLDGVRSVVNNLVIVRGS